MIRADCGGLQRTPAEDQPRDACGRATGWAKLSNATSEAATETRFCPMWGGSVRVSRGTSQVPVLVPFLRLAPRTGPTIASSRTPFALQGEGGRALPSGPPPNPISPTRRRNVGDLRARWSRCARREKERHRTNKVSLSILNSVLRYGQHQCHIRDTLGVRFGHPYRAGEESRCQCAKWQS